MTAAEQITDRNHAHDQADLHEIIRRLDVIETGLSEMATAVYIIAGLVDEFRPLIEAYRQTAGGTVGVFRARKALRNGN